MICQFLKILDLVDVVVILEEKYKISTFDILLIKSCTPVVFISVS